MAMSMGWMTLLVLLLGGNANELLDYLPADQYWQTQGVTEITVETMSPLLASADEAGDVSALVRDLGADDFATREAAQEKLLAMGPGVIEQVKPATEAQDPEIAHRAQAIVDQLAQAQRSPPIKRLMAIRALGELGDETALATLEPLLESKRPFEAEYARRAVAAIRGEAHERSQVTQAQRDADLALLPGNCVVVAQMVLTEPGASKPLDFEAALGKLPADLQGQRQNMMQQLVQGVMYVANQVGNFRIDSVTMGITDGFDKRTGFVMFVGRGEYDPEAVGRWFEQESVFRQDMDGVAAYVPDNEIAFLLPSRDRLVVLAGPRDAAAQASALVPSLKTPPEAMQVQGKVAELLEQIDRSVPLWAVAQNADEFRREIAPIATFDHATLTSRREGEVMHFTLTAEGNDAAAVQQFAAQAREQQQEMLQMMKQMEGQQPMISSYVKALENVAIAVENRTLTATTHAEGNLLGAAGPLLFMGIGIH